jgi:hypothetical protein
MYGLEPKETTTTTTATTKETKAAAAEVKATKEPVPTTTPLDAADWELVIREMATTLVPGGGATANNKKESVWMVLCADRNHCPSLKPLMQNKNTKVSSFVSCPDIVNGTTQALAKCEYALEQEMRKMPDMLDGISLSWWCCK